MANNFRTFYTPSFNTKSYGPSEHLNNINDDSVSCESTVLYRSMLTDFMAETYEGIESYNTKKPEKQLEMRFLLVC